MKKIFKSFDHKALLLMLSCCCFIYSSIFTFADNGSLFHTKGISISSSVPANSSTDIVTDSEMNEDDSDVLSHKSICKIIYLPANVNTARFGQQNSFSAFIIVAFYSTKNTPLYLLNSYFRI